MKLLFEEPPQTLPYNSQLEHVLSCNTIYGLKQINEAQYNIAALKRKPIVDMSSLLNKITYTLDFHFYETAGREKLIKKLMNYIIENCHIKVDSELAYLIADIEQLISVFAGLSNSKKVKLMLTVANTNMCELFHTDINELRLLCTYKGRGTLWVENDNVNWQEMNCCKTNEALIKDQTKIHEAKPFEVLILKGALHEYNSTQAILHRSPTVTETKSNRLLLRIDTQNFGKF
jgi:hypothetical protein